MRIPTGIQHQRLVPIAACRPGLLAPSVAWRAPDPIDEPARRHVVGHEHHARPQEEVLAHLQPDLVPDRRRCEAPPGDLRPPRRRVLAGDVLSDHRVDSVHADQQVAARLATVGEADRDGVSFLLHGHAASAECHVLIPDGGVKRIMEIGPVHVVERSAPASDRCVCQRQPGEQGAVPPIAVVPRARNDANSAERISEPKAVQHPHSVGTDRETCAHLTKHRGLLVDVDIETGLTQRQGGRQPADPSAGDEHAHTAMVERRTNRSDHTKLPTQPRTGAPVDRADSSGSTECTPSRTTEPTRAAAASARKSGKRERPAASWPPPHLNC